MIKGILVIIMKISDNAISEVVGALILVALVIVGIGVIGLFMTSGSPPQAMEKAVISGSCTRCPNIVGAEDGESRFYSIIVQHQGGEAINPDTLSFFVDTKENPGNFREVKVSDYFDSSTQSMSNLREEMCYPEGYGHLTLVKDLNELNVGDAARIWYDMYQEDANGNPIFNWEKPRSVRIFIDEKKQESSMGIPEFKVIARENDYDNPEIYEELYGNLEEGGDDGGTGGTGEPSKPADPSAIIPVDAVVCKCRSPDYNIKAHEDDDPKGKNVGKETCVAQFNYTNAAGVPYTIPIRESGTPWNEFTGSGMVKQYRCQPETFEVIGTPFWTNRFWNNIKWKLGSTQSALVKCQKSTPWCDDVIVPGGSDSVCKYCEDGVTY